MPAVKTCPLDPADLVTRFHAEAIRQGFRVEPFGERDGVELSAYTKRALGAKPRIYVTAGVHGDEPAPPQALLEALAEGLFDDRATWFLIPMVNPAGYRLNHRENDQGIDLNRDYLTPLSPEVRGQVAWLQRQPRFDLALCLHEDWEATGFYLYELARTAPLTFAQHVREAVAPTLPIEPGDIIDGRPIDEPGIIRPENDPALREQWPEAIYLFKHHTHHSLTFETPTALPLAGRITAHVAAIRVAIKLTVASYP